MTRADPETRDRHGPGIYVPERSPEGLPEGLPVTLLRRPAPPGLRRWYTEIIAYDERAGCPIRQIESASLTVPLIVSLGEPFRIGLGRRPDREDARPSFAAGLTTERVYIGSTGRAACLQINLTPLGARHVLGLPVAALTGAMIPLEDCADRDVLDFKRRIEDLTDWERRLDLAEAFVWQRLVASRDGTPQVVHAYRRIVGSGGQAGIAAIGEEIGWSRKHLSQRFRDEIGLPPKTVARIARFVRAQTLARFEAVPEWADIACDCGYADQAHMIREFGAFAGLTPRAWRTSLDNFGIATW